MNLQNMLFQSGLMLSGFALEPFYVLSGSSAMRFLEISWDFLNSVYFG